MVSAKKNSFHFRFWALSFDGLPGNHLNRIDHWPLQKPLSSFCDSDDESPPSRGMFSLCFDNMHPHFIDAWVFRLHSGVMSTYYRIYLPTPSAKIETAWKRSFSFTLCFHFFQIYLQLKICQPQHAIPGNVKAATSGGTQPISVNLVPWQLALTVRVLGSHMQHQTLWSILGECEAYFEGH